MSKPFFTKHEFVSSHLGKEMDIVSPGKRLSASLEVPDVTIMLGDYKFLSSPMVLGNSDIDLILGMAWLSKHKAQLDCAARQIQLTHSSKDVIVFAARDNTIRLFSLNEKVNWMPSLKFQSFANIKTSFQKSSQECLRTGQ